MVSKTQQWPGGTTGGVAPPRNGYSPCQRIWDLIYAVLPTGVAPFYMILLRRPATAILCESQRTRSGRLLKHWSHQMALAIGRLQYRLQEWPNRVAVDQRSSGH
jgi:hypothetical protein